MTVKVASFGKTVSDVPNQTVRTATDIGNLQVNNSLLNVVGNLAKNEKNQDFKFTVLPTSASGNLVLSNKSDASVRVQILGPGQRVIADSQTGQGVASANWTAIQPGGEGISLKPGQYTMVVTRAPGNSVSKAGHFDVAMQLGKNTPKNDYTTTIAPATTPAPTQAPNPLLSMLNDMYPSFGSLSSSDSTTDPLSPSSYSATADANFASAVANLTNILA
ncbi:MAG: hypothetical protein HQL37_05985 [Alphaproteobacteria bacterium]|nr:hypothetical protein [Alphaproteobacteria bacterium]